MKEVFICSSYSYYCEKPICMRCTVTQLARESVGLAPFRGWYMKEFKLSHSNLINRIIKITHAHNLHVKMFLTFAIKLCIIQCWDWYPNIITLLPTEFMSNCQSIPKILISTHLMLFNAMKQSLIISATSFFQVYSLMQELCIFTQPLGKVNKYYALITFMTAKLYQIWMHLSCQSVNLQVCWTLYEREYSMFMELIYLVQLLKTQLHRILPS